MSAKEMFEELGYEQRIIEKNIIYNLKEGNDYSKEIYFVYRNKSIDLEYGFDEGYGLINCTYNMSLKELQAINKQISELGWNNEK